MRCEWTEEALAAEVAATRFALIELTLFLDTHPDDKAALSAFCEYRDRYAELAGKLAAEYGCETIVLQELLDGAIKQYGRAAISPDGMNPSPAASRMIADEWLRVFDSKEEK